MTILNKILISLGKIKTNPKTAWKLSKLMQAVERELHINREKYSYLIQSYGQKDSKGEVIVKSGEVQIPKDKKEEFLVAVKELQTVAIPDIKFTLSEIEDFSMSANDIMWLADFIEEE